ncbi:MAG: ribosome-binding factor A [Deltaproteobacteria bacterium CG07_land_8_20_14_0_80_38_7]|nr:MAG: ribosome-binding factor A [Deltaproteobacteria bacterium CG07_land_8_20_14_0_80_38_7]
MAKNLPYDRSQRVADEIYHILATSCITELDDPRLKGLQISRVRITKDLRIARVYYYLRENNEQSRKIAKKGLESAARYFKDKIGKEMSLRYIPQLEFFYDDTVDIENRIEELMTGAGFK